MFIYKNKIIALFLCIFTVISFSTHNLTIALKNNQQNFSENDLKIYCINSKVNLCASDKVNNCKKKGISIIYVIFLSLILLYTTPIVFSVHCTVSSDNFVKQIISRVVNLFDDNIHMNTIKYNKRKIPFLSNETNEFLRNNLYILEDKWGFFGKIPGGKKIAFLAKAIAEYVNISEELIKLNNFKKEIWYYYFNLIYKNLSKLNLE